MEHERSRAFYGGDYDDRVLSDPPLSDNLIFFHHLFPRLILEPIARSGSNSSDYQPSIILLCFNPIYSLRANMAISLSSFLLPISLLSSIAHCATVTYDFDIAWTYANPDGQQTRPVQGINGKWPIPPIVATKGDQVIVNVKNSLGNESTSLHFHGLYQNGTTHMDGPTGVSQCGILPGSSFTYNFTVRIADILASTPLYCGVWMSLL